VSTHITRKSPPAGSPEGYRTAPKLSTEAGFQATG
jgi:hypothetical protein